MIARMLDSRLSLGSDRDRCRPVPYPYAETSKNIVAYVGARTIRVVVGRLGDTFRLSAPDLGLIADGESIEVAWERFLGLVGDRDDAAWLMFDVGPTRPEEIQQGLDAPEDEDWAEPCDANEAD